MEPHFKKLTDFLREIGVDSVAHSNKSYLAHLAGLYRYLEDHGFGTEVARAGMFHSIYGTEKFQGFKLPVERRPEVRTLIGERAERLAYWNCAMDRASFDRAAMQETGPHRIIDRLTGATIDVTPQDFDDLCRIHLFDWMEQVPRSHQWDYRRPAYRRLAERLGPTAQQEYERVFAQETAAVRT
jgi:hypothetical protein